MSGPSLCLTHVSFFGVLHLKEGGLTLRDLAISGVKPLILLQNVHSSVLMGERSPQRRLEFPELHTVPYTSHVALGTYMISRRVFDMSSLSFTRTSWRVPKCASGG